MDGVRLTEFGLAALERALTGRGERRGAFDLLVADALLTYACESAAVATDAEAALLGIVEQVARRSG